MSERPTSQSLHYEFRFADGSVRAFEVALRLPEFQLVPREASAAPAWTRLENHQCRHCPLRSPEHAHCPVARNLAGVIEIFRDSLSHERAEVTVRTGAREYRKEVALQSGLSSLMGLVMVTSGCPIMDRLRPMAATHLPFATLEETLLRALSTYLLAQFFRQRRGLAPDWTLARFADVYEDVATLNRCFRDRLATIEMRDANFNALIHLDCFAVFGSMGIEDEELGLLESVFRAHLS